MAAKKEQKAASEVELSEKVEKKEDEKEIIVDNIPTVEDLTAKISELESLLAEKEDRFLRGPQGQKLPQRHHP